MSIILSRLRIITCKNIIVRTYAAAKKGATAAPAAAPVKTSSKKIILPVERDVNRLLNYVCGTNILKEGGEDVKIKPESEYPDWLWEIYTGPPKKLHELDPTSKAYWQKVRIMGIRRNNRLRRIKPF